MWQNIQFTPEEERILDEIHEEIAREMWEELGIPRPEGGVPPKKASRRSAPKKTRKRRGLPYPGTPQPPQEP
jgi:hypothetical protein